MVSGRPCPVWSTRPPASRYGESPRAVVTLKRHLDIVIRQDVFHSKNVLQQQQQLPRCSIQIEDLTMKCRLLARVGMRCQHCKERTTSGCIWSFHPHEASGASCEDVSEDVQPRDGCFLKGDRGPLLEAIRVSRSQIGLQVNGVSEGYG